jgi:hypothetical protein
MTFSSMFMSLSAILSRPGCLAASSGSKAAAAIQDRLSTQVASLPVPSKHFLPITNVEEPNRYCVDSFAACPGRFWSRGQITAASLVCPSGMSRRKAAVNRAHSKRFAKFEDARQSRLRLDCACFSTAFDSMFDVGRSIFDVLISIKKPVLANGL